MLVILSMLGYSNYMSGGKLATKFIILGFYALVATGTIQMYHYINNNILDEFRTLYSTAGSDEFQRQLAER